MKNQTAHNHIKIHTKSIQDQTNINMGGFTQYYCLIKSTKNNKS